MTYPHSKYSKKGKKRTEWLWGFGNSVRPSEGMAEGGCGWNSAMPERNQKVDSPAVLLEEAGHHRKTFFSFYYKWKQYEGC